MSKAFEEVSNSYKKLKLHELEENKRYKFYTIDNIIFDAVFERIIGDTLIVKNYVSGKVKDGPIAIRMFQKNSIDYVISEQLNFPF